MGELDHYVKKVVNVITNDGKVIVGILQGFDNTMNIVLSDSHERFFSKDQGVAVTQHGLYIIRGDNV